MLLYIKVKRGAGSVRLPGNRESGPVPGNSGRAMECLTDFIRLNMEEINMNPKNGTMSFSLVSEQLHPI